MRYNGRSFKLLVESTQSILKEFIDNNVGGTWNSNLVDKTSVEDAINNQDRVYVNYTTPQKGEHERVFVPTSVMYSNIKNRYRILGWDMNKAENDGRVAFILNKISDWRNLDAEERQKSAQNNQNVDLNAKEVDITNGNNPNNADNTENNNRVQ